jgi:hypothetical protein
MSRVIFSGAAAALCGGDRSALWPVLERIFGSPVQEGILIMQGMNPDFSPLTQWALADSRTAEERYLIFLVCEACRLLEHLRKPIEYQREHIYKSLPQELWKELYLNPLLQPDIGPGDTERAARMAEFLTKFSPNSDYEKRKVGDAGAVLQFFPAMEVVALGSTAIKDISFVESLPKLRCLQLSSGVLEDLEPLRGCAALRELSLGFTGSGPPHFTPPVYWLDAQPLGALKGLEKLTIYPNPAILKGLSFPALTSADFSGGHCVQPDCTHLPDMPELRLLKLDGVQSLLGISRFPQLRHLKISGPLRDWGDISALKELDCLEVDTQDGWPRDVLPLTALPNLLWVRFGGDIPRNYWPLGQSPRLREVCVGKVPSVQLDVQAVNAGLESWDGIFGLPELRPRKPLRFVAAEWGYDPGTLPPSLPEPGPEFLRHPKLFHLERLWMQARVDRALEKVVGTEGLGDRAYRSTYEGSWERSVVIHLETLEATNRLPQVLDAAREALAASAHAWRCSVAVDLRLTALEMTEQQKKWLRQIEEERNRDDDDDSEDRVNRYTLTQQHIIETQFRLRASEEEGEELDPEDFVPPEAIRPDADRRGKLVPAGASGEDEQEDNPDFALKPFDEQEQNSDNDGDDADDHDVAIAPPPEPPEDFWEDPYRHPLSESYRIYATLTLDTFFYNGNNLATVQQLLDRGPDEYHAKPPA